MSVFADQEPALLRIHGSNTLGARLVPKMVHAWLENKGYHNISTKDTQLDEQLISAEADNGANKMVVEIHAHGSSTAFKDMGNGRADIGMASRPIKPEELQALTKLGRLDQPENEYVVALDGVSVIVHHDNPVKTIPLDTLRGIFSGKITDWSALGQRKGKIHVLARDQNSGTYDTFASLVLGKDTALVANAKRFESNAQLSDAVAGDIDAVGFVGLAAVGKARSVAVADEGAKALPPMPFNVSTEDYALSRRLFLYLPEKPRLALAQEFAEFALSESAQEIVNEVGFVSLNVLTKHLSIGENAPDEYKELTSKAERLSLNIRFRPGYTTLDNKAISDVERLVSFMAKPENRNRKLMLFGFADSKESVPYLSLSLSISRADAVADYLIKNGLAPAKVRGFGQELPVASNKSPVGRHTNRRVEVWIE
jgi:phosphate transport system substrate-binding protein